MQRFHRASASLAYAVSNMSESALGKATRYSDSYNPELLHSVDRAEGRGALNLGASLPFSGVDVWNAWELSWLDEAGKPVVATMTMSVPADSPRIVESKSLKLYLNSLSMSRYPSADAVAAVLTADLGRAAGASIGLDLTPAASLTTGRIEQLPGRCIDYEDVVCDTYEVDASLLSLLKTGNDTVSESLHSHVLRSNCPVTGQPDTGSVLISYHGPRIDPGSLLLYLSSFRRHSDFHELCVERIFCDLKARCATERLSVYARYNRRGGIDINPFRSDFEAAPPNTRLWRQ
jgi:7-cyano-7-deazaguanine reductase